MIKSAAVIALAVRCFSAMVLGLLQILVHARFYARRARSGWKIGAPRLTRFSCAGVAPDPAVLVSFRARLVWLREFQNANRLMPDHKMFKYL